MIFEIENFPPIKKAKAEIGDLTILVGPQGSGKTIFLQMYYLSQCGEYVVKTLQKGGYQRESVEQFLQGFLGEGVFSYQKDTSIRMDGKLFSLEALVQKRKIKKPSNRVFAIPAQRVIVVGGGWPEPSKNYNSSYPFVMREFSHNLNLLLDQGLGGVEGTIFPQEKRLKKQIREKLDQAIYHHQKIVIDKSRLQKRLMLEVKDGVRLPIMTWSTGQREFTPLLLGLYYLLPSAGAGKRKDVDEVIIEEPETGLHPKAVKEVMFALLELISRGYRMLISTHSADVVMIAWFLRLLSTYFEKKREICVDKVIDFFDMDNQRLWRQWAETILSKKIKVYYADLESGASTFVDISELNTSVETDRSQWGGLLEVADRALDLASDVVDVEGE
ncbi:MAG: ATP-binding protein [Brevinematales bacterium]|nr:ATP-binding protein [Brevinematales bacterium]